MSAPSMVCTSTAPSGVRWSPARYLEGTGFPEGVVTAPVGTRYTDTAATNGAIEWIKATGTGATGWRVTYGDTVPLRVRSDVASPYAFIGTAPVGTADADTGWLVSRIHLTAHETQTATGAWEDHATLTYS